MATSAIRNNQVHVRMIRDLLCSAGELPDFASDQGKTLHCECCLVQEKHAIVLPKCAYRIAFGSLNLMSGKADDYFF